MAFDPKAIETLAAQLAQGAAPVLGGVLGGPAGAVVAPMIVSALASALGVPPTPQAISTAIAADPVGAPVKLAPIESANGALVKSAEQAYLDDVANARAAEVEYAKSGSSAEWGVGIVSTLAVGVFGYALYILLSGKGQDNPSVNLLIGGAIAGYTQVLNFWLGSSKSSADKNAQISSIIASLTPRKK